MRSEPCLCGKPITECVDGQRVDAALVAYLATKEAPIAAAAAEQAAFEQRTAFYASQRAIDAMCPACKQPQSAPSCERREHW